MKLNLRLLCTIAFMLVFAIKSNGQSTPNTMSAHFINVGQADATLLEFQCGAILIDAGAAVFSVQHQAERAIILQH